MRQARAHRFGWYIMVSVLIHLIGASWAFRQPRLIALPTDRDSGIRVRMVTSASGLTSTATAQSAPLPVSNLASSVPVQPTLDTPAAPPALDSQVPLPSPATMAYQSLQPSPVRQVRKRLPTRKRPPRRVTKVASAKPPPPTKRQPQAESSQPPRRQPAETAKREVGSPQPKTPLTTASLEPSPPVAGPLRRESADRPSQASPTHAGKQQLPGQASRDASTSGGPYFVFQPKPKYPMIARRRGWEGTVVLNLEVLADGSIGTVEVVHSSGYRQLDKTAKTTVQRWKHQPQRPRAQGAKKWATQEIHFKLD